MKLKVPFLKKKKNQVEEDDYLDLMDTTEETVTDYTVSDTDATISIDSLEDVTRTETAEYDEELDDDEEYEYVTPHYTLNAVLLTLAAILIGAAATFFLVREPMYESIKNVYLEQGYIKTEGAFAIPEDIAAGKTAYVNGQMIIGTYVELDTSNATATPGDILKGYTAYVNGAKIEGTIASFTPDDSYIPGTKDTVVPKGYYLNGDIVVAGEVNFTANNIRKGATIFGVAGTRD